jgi:hypothetical protein
MEHSAWVDSFVTTLRRLGVRGQEQFLGDIGEQLHHTQSHLDPEDVAHSEWEIWPPEKGRVSAREASS